MKRIFILIVSCLFILCNIVKAQVFNTDTSVYMVTSIEGGATWTNDASGIFSYDNGGEGSTLRAILYSSEAYQSVDGFKLSIEYTTGSIGDDEGHNLSFGLVSSDTDLSTYVGNNPFKTEQSLYSIGANLTTNGDAATQGLNFSNGSEVVTFDQSGTNAQFAVGTSTKVTIEIGVGGYWSYRINDVYEASGVLLEDFDLSKSYRVAIFGQDDNGGGKSIQSIELKKRYAAGERASKVRSTWSSGVYPDLVDERITSLKTLDGLGVSFTNGASLSADHKAPHKLLESLSYGDVDSTGNRINLIVPEWGHLNFENPENDPLMDQIEIVKSAGFKVKAYVNCENFVGANQDQHLVFVERWFNYCDTDPEVQAFINSQPYHTGIWNSSTQQYEDATATYPLRKYMFCYAEFVLKDYALRYGKYIDNWIFDDGSTMGQMGDNTTSGVIEEQRIFQAYANAVHAGNPEIPIAFNNGRSTTSYDAFPFAIPTRFDDFTFGHAFGGNNDHASKTGTQFANNYKHVARMTATDGNVHDGGNWTWDDKIVGNFHSKLSTTAWKYGPTQAWEQGDFNQWNLEAMQAGGSMTWDGSFNRTETTVYAWVYVMLDSLDDYLAQYENPGAPNWARYKTILPDAKVGEAYSYDLVEELDFWDPEGDEITELSVVTEEGGAPSWLMINETTEGTWTLAGTPSEAVNTTYDFTLRVKDATGEADRTIHLKVVNPNVIIPVTSLIVASHADSMYVNDEIQMDTEVLPLDASNRSLNWSSSNTSVTTVDANGLVTTKGIGASMIIATTADGAYSDSCEIRVVVEVKQRCTLPNVALCGEASQSSIDFDGVPERAIDDNTNGMYKGKSVTHTATELNPWWEVDLGLEYNIGVINIFNRLNPASKSRLSNFTVFVYDADSAEVFSETFTTYPDPSVSSYVDGAVGQRVKILLNDSNVLSLAEVQVFEYIPVTGVNISTDSLALFEGDTESVTAALLPSDATNPNLIWKSNDTSVVNVDANGLITAIDSGSAIITVTSLEGNYTDECHVEVNSFYPVETINISVDSLSLMVGDTSSLNVMMLPTNATNQSFMWKSSNTLIARVSAGGLVTALDSGSVIVTATTSEGLIADTCFVTVLPDTTASGLFDNKAAEVEAIHLYPNPAKNVLNYEFHNAVDVITIYSLSGKIMIKRDVNELIGEINISSLESGIYILKTQEQIPQFTRFIKE